MVKMVSKLTILFISGCGVPLREALDVLRIIIFNLIPIFATAG
jgi:hypothetical protein